MLRLLNDLIDTLQAKFPPNRVVVLLTPVFSAASGWIAVYAAEHTPFLNLTQGELTAVFVAGAGVVVPAVYKWLDGWQKHEERVALTPRPGKAIPVLSQVPREYTSPNVASVPVTRVVEEVPETPAPTEDELRRRGFPPEKS